MKVTSFQYLIFIFLSLSLYQNTSAQSNEEKAEEMLRLVNEIRTAEDLEPLVLNQELNEAAFLHSKDMGDQNYFDHTGLDGSNFSERARDAGYTGSPRGENIAAGNRTVAATFNQWFNSPGHLRNMLSAQSNEMGIGHAEVNGSRFTHYWTQVFGRTNVLSVDDIVNNQPPTFKIYPNPVQDLIHITLPKDMQSPKKLRLMSIKGQVVYQQTLTSSNELTIPVDHLPKGIYLLNIQGISVQKIVKR